MAVELEGPQRPETMTRRQLERRRRVLAAVHQLLTERPVRDVQVKDIAERAQVSLAAIYHYFSSKDHILAEALVDWAAGLGGRPGRPRAAFPDLLRHAVRAYRRAPQYAELYLASSASGDPHAVACMGRLADQVGGTMLAALDDLDPEAARRVWQIVGHAWTGGLFECVHGRTSFAQLEDVLVDAARLLLGAAPRTGPATS